MNNILTDPEHLKNLMSSLGLRPKDYLGQNFLISEDVLGEIVSVAEIKKSDTVIEIGPGLGVLTQKLVLAANKIIALEKDRAFIPVLKNFFSKEQKLEIIEQDVLKFNFETIPGSYKIVANIPYYLTSHLLQILLTLKHKPEKIVFMMQKEVGERLVASAGELSLLGISVQIFSDVSIAATVPKENFWPRPKVDSVIVVIDPKEKFPKITDEKLFFRMLKIAFAGKRKQIHNTLINGFKLPKAEIEQMLSNAGISSAARPQELTIEQWIKLFMALKSRQEQ